MQVTNRLEFLKKKFIHGDDVILDHFFNESFEIIDLKFSIVD